MPAGNQLTLIVTSIGRRSIARRREWQSQNRTSRKGRQGGKERQEEFLLAIFASLASFA
jgi:hypothetical protein